MEDDNFSPARDRELGMDRNITRDFLNGVAIAIGALGDCRQGFRRLFCAGPAGILSSNTDRHARQPRGLL